MKKVAVFGKPGSGKSVLSKTLAHATGLPLHQLDSIVYKPNGEFVDREELWRFHSRGPTGEVVNNYDHRMQSCVQCLERKVQRYSDSARADTQ